MDYTKQLQRWIDCVEDDELKEELVRMRDENDTTAIEDAFYQDLVFGTAGLRGTLAAGPNRMNVYTVGRATQGLAEYLNKNFDNPSVAIGRDSRNKGEDFVRITAEVLAANGIKAYVYSRIEPTPALAWATQYKNCSVGICITASHNPKEYNGYKVFGADGCQISGGVADAIQAAIGDVDIFDGVKRKDFDEALKEGLIEYIEDKCIEDLVDTTLANLPEDPKADVSKLSVVYTPLNGTGLEPITMAFKKMGIGKVTIVPEQKDPDGNFPTCPFPNPEIREALQKGLELCEKEQPDFLLATDPDADRMGTAVKHNGEYVLVSGNEMGILLTDYVCNIQKDPAVVAKQVIVTTIVSTAMLDVMADHFGFELRRTLTGFKNIGGQMARLEDAGEKERFVFGFEESYGYLNGPHVRDKDAIGVSELLCQMAAHHKAEGKDLIDVLEGLYDKFGYYLNGLQNFSYPGAEGARRMDAIMTKLRENPPTEVNGLKVTKLVDYNTGAPMEIHSRLESEPQTQPISNVLEFQLEDGYKFLVRPSGTEPKIKVYAFVVGTSRDDAQARMEKFQAALDKVMA